MLLGECRDPEGSTTGGVRSRTPAVRPLLLLMPGRLWPGHAVPPGTCPAGHGAAAQQPDGNGQKEEEMPNPHLWGTSNRSSRGAGRVWLRWFPRPCPPPAAPVHGCSLRSTRGAQGSRCSHRALQASGTLTITGACPLSSSGVPHSHHPAALISLFPSLGDLLPPARCGHGSGAGTTEHQELPRCCTQSPFPWGTRCEAAGSPLR